jgi:type II restriction/modification system DNA methylase subunit YeeA
MAFQPIGGYRPQPSRVPPPVTPDEFIAKWKAAELKERSAAQSHFIDLCRMLDEPAPTDADPTGEWYAFERGATKTTGGEGWADVWKRDHFGWEYKGKRKDLNAAFAQLQQYALALENPPLLVVCDLDRFRIHTNWTNSVSEVHEFSLDDLRDANVRQKLKWVFSDPERLKPGKTRQALTEEAAAEFAKLAQRLRDRGHAAETVAHFINRLVFCMFAEDVDLLPNKMFKRMLEHAATAPDDFQALASDLFKAMKSGGRIGFEHVAWFNGGLFNDDTALPLDKDDIALTLVAAKLDWAEIDPSILGTLFERGLDPDKRSQLGAHYTDREKIMMIVDPVIMRPWVAEWEAAKAEIAVSLDKANAAKNASVRTKARDQATATYRTFLNKLRAFRALDPACGSGNFLYLALLGLKDIEHRVSIEAEAMGLQREFPQVGPASVKGIEINHYAAELARVSVWIGEIQWMRRNGFGVSDRPILKPLDNIECRDAILNPNGTEAAWPQADVVIGNPPFLGNKKMRRLLGDEYVEALRKEYRETLPGACDLVCIWFEKTRQLLDQNQLARAGLVATKTIQSKTNRPVLRAICDSLRMFEVWSNEEWVVDGADVRVSVINFTANSDTLIDGVRLDGQPVERINSDLTGITEVNGALDLTRANVLAENKDVAFQGVIKTGAFDIPAALAREWLLTPLNPNGRPNADVLKPFLNGSDLTKRAPDRWVIDFPTSMTEKDASAYELPFAYAEQKIKAKRKGKREKKAATKWWLHQRPRPEMRKALNGLTRCIVTSRVARHSVFVWLSTRVLADSRLVVFARDDDTTFGILSSRFHTQWAVRKGMKHGVGNDPQYTPTEGFQTFPFPDGLTLDLPATAHQNDDRAQQISAAARELNEMRDRWLYPADLVERVPEVVPSFPARIVLRDAERAAEFRQRTLANLYGQKPAWLLGLHQALDAAVARAYGWPADISEDDALAELFALNQARAASQIAQGELVANANEN